MIARLWERVTGRPWTTTRSCAAEFGPPPAADPVYVEALRHYTDAELVAYGHAILAEIRQQQQAVDRLLQHARQHTDDIERSTP